jgi:L-lysine exporter family protein LysE/ArgO
MLTALVAGFMLSFTLLLAIGAQNAFVLKQGLLNQHVFLVCTLCALSDATLIAVGVFGLSYIISIAPGIVDVLRYVGAFFLFLYGAKSFYNAFCSSKTLSIEDGGRISMRSTILTCLMFTWLNPHVYLDTVFLIGSIANQFQNYQIYFTTGAVTASLVFFYSLGFGASLLRPMVASGKSWRRLEFCFGIIMFTLAIKILFYI